MKTARVSGEEQRVGMFTKLSVTAVEDIAVVRYSGTTDCFNQERCSERKLHR